MIGWLSTFFIILVGAAALRLPAAGEALQEHVGSALAWPLLLLALVGAAFLLARKVPRWSLSHRFATWAAAIVGFVIVMINLPVFLGTGQRQPPAAPPAAPRATANAADDAGDAAGGPARAATPRPAVRLRRSLAAGDLPAPGEPVFFSEEEALSAPIPGAPRRVIVRDQYGDEYPFWLNPGESLPEGLTDVDAQARMAIALGAWAEIPPTGASGHFFTTAQINNAPVRVLVDTGASAVALSCEDARKAGINAMTLRYTVPVATAGGMVKAAPVTLRRVEVDGVLVRDVRAWVMPCGAMRGTLLGMSFLSRLREFSVRDGRLILRQ